MKTPLVLLALVLSATAGLAMQQSKSGVNSPQHKGSKNEADTDNKAPSKSDYDKEKKSAELESFISSAQAVPAEFSADLLLQLVESGKIKEPKRRQDLLVEAFYTAAKSKAVA